GNRELTRPRQRGRLSKGAPAAPNASRPGGPLPMKGLTTALLSLACRTFLTLAYPGGEKTIPDRKRPYLHIAPDADLAAFLPPAAAAHGIGQVIRGEDGAFRGYAFRLGSACFAHLKMQVTSYNHDCCIFAVDTHDSLPRLGGRMPAP